jgi:glycosyltransferase involved in cell wall biosynthesis
VVNVLVSDNCSTDDTKKVAESYQSKYGFVSYFRNDTNVGGIANFDLAIRRAKTTHCWLLGDDSILNPGSIKHVSQILTEYPKAGFVFLDGNNLPSTKGSYLHQKYKELGLYFEVDDLSALLNSVSIQALGCISALVIDRSQWETATYNSLPSVFFYNQIHAVLEIMSRKVQVVYSHKLCFVSSRANESHNDWYIDNAPMSVLLEWPWYRIRARSFGFTDHGRGVFQSQLKWKLNQLLIVIGFHPYFETTYRRIISLEPSLVGRVLMRLIINGRFLIKPFVRWWKASRFQNSKLTSKQIVIEPLP